MSTELPEDIRLFIDEVVDSFVVWDLLIFCSKKTHEPQVAKEVPRLLGRQEAELEKPMRKLQELGIVFSKKRADGEMVCELNVQSKLMEPLKKFWAYNEQQENRLKILTYLLSRKIR